MANFKRRKTKRNVRCTMCTAHRWMGNAKGRLTKRDLVARSAAKDESRQGAAADE